jgi:hypothetical protein
MTLLPLLRRALRAALGLMTLLIRQWRLWLVTGLLAALLSVGVGLSRTALWASEGDVILQPTFILEGYMLATNELAQHYAVRLEAEGRVERVLRQLEIEEEPHLVEATSKAGGIISLRVEHPEPLESEAITRALLVDFRAEVEGENRIRQEADRLVVTLSPSSFAYSANTPLPVLIARGFAIGLLGGIMLVLGQGWLQRGRIITPLEAEQLTGAPTLAAIPSN